MIITSVKVHKLVSGPGYNNNSVGAEAVVLEGDDPVAIHDELVGWVDARLANLKAAEDLRAQLSNLHWEVERLQRAKTEQEEIITRGKKIIAAHEKLAELAKEHDVKYEGELGDLIPF